MQRSIVGIVCFALGVCLFSGTALAQDFSGYYDPANWILDTNTDGSLDSSGAPSQITLIGPNSGTTELEYIDFFIVAPADGIFAFNWSYVSDDDPTFDESFYIHNTFFPLSDTSGESGSVSIPVIGGDTIGFSIESIDGEFGAGSLTISSFSAPIPEPASLGLLAGAGILLLRRRT